MKKEYITQGTCSKLITIEYDNETGVIESVEFLGGCPGNTLGIATLVKGKTIGEVRNMLTGIDCRNRGTSCPDQLARALAEIEQGVTIPIYRTIPFSNVAERDCPIYIGRIFTWAAPPGR